MLIKIKSYDTMRSFPNIEWFRIFCVYTATIHYSDGTISNR